MAKIGYSIFVYDLTEDPAGLKMLKETYGKAGLREPADPSLGTNASKPWGQLDLREAQRAPG